MPEISDVRDERIRSYRSLRQGRWSEHILVEGPEALNILLRSSLKIESIFLDESYAAKFSEIFVRRPELLDHCFVANKALMSEIVGYRLHRGVMAIAERPKMKRYTELRLPIVAFCGLVDAENVGSIVRSAHAFGISSFIVDRHTADPLLRRAIRVSVGASLVSSLAYVESLEDCLKELGTKAEIIAVEQTEDAQEVSRAEFSSRSVFVLGKEKGGIAKSVIDYCARVISIPIVHGVVSSLNVSHAAAIVFSHYANSLDG